MTELGRCWLAGDSERSRGVHHHAYDTENVHNDFSAGGCTPTIDRKSACIDWHSDRNHSEFDEITRWRALSDTDADDDGAIRVAAAKSDIR